MNYLILLIPGILLLILIAIFIWIIIKKRKKKKLKTQTEYDLVYNDFNTAEDMYQQALKGGGEYGGKVSPYAILWEIARQKRRVFTQADSGVGTGNKLPELPELPSRPEDIQGYSSKTDAGYESEFSKDKRRNRKSLFRRRG